MISCPTEVTYLHFQKLWYTTKYVPVAYGNFTDISLTILCPFLLPGYQLCQRLSARRSLQRLSVWRCWYGTLFTLWANN